MAARSDQNGHILAPISESNPMLVVFALIAAASQLTSGESSYQGYFRHPAIHAETIVFTSEGDLWRVPIAGGAASRLTTHAEQETHAAISPNGNLVAFSASYEGPTEVYVIPIQGGRPKRVTYDGETGHVVGWTPDGRIVYATQHYSTLPNDQLVAIDPRTGDTTIYPLDMACEVAFKPNGLTLFFARTRPQRGAVKRYKGGTAQQLWKYTLGDDEAIRLTDPQDYAGASREPMWWDDRLYFLTDRDGTMNIWSMDENGDDLKQHTSHSRFDVQSPSMHEGRLVYQNGADLFVWNSKKPETPRKVNIHLVSDFDQTRERWIEKPVDWLSNVALSPNGKQVALTARGNVFVQPVKAGRRVRITRSNGVRHRHAVFSSDSKSVFALSDETGETEFWKYAADGSDEAQQLTNDGDVLRWNGIPSTDGKYLAFTDKNLRLGLIDLKSKTSKIIFKSKVDAIGTVQWSPNNGWIAFVTTAENFNNQIRLYHVESGVEHVVTSDRVNSFSPAWSPHGDWLYFLSDRHLVSRVGSPWGLRQPEPYIATPTKIYMLALQDGLVSPFLPPTELSSNSDKNDASDEKKEDETAPPDEKQPRDKGNDAVAKVDTAKEDNSDSQSESPDESKDGEKVDEKEDKRPVEIQFAGLPNRLFTVPVPAGRYSGLKATDDHLYYVEKDLTTDDSNLRAIKLEPDAQSELIVSDMFGFRMSSDRSHALVRRNSSIHVFKADGDAPKLDDTKLSLSDWRFSIDPREEWRQMFTDAWRLERDYFYDRGMHGVPWEEIRNRYLPLVARVHDRAELSNLLHQMVGELEALHIFVSGGDHRKAENDVHVASLGAVLQRDESAGGYRIQRIYRTDPDYPEHVAPLLRPEVAAKETDVIVAINHVPVLSVPNLQILLRDQVEKQVMLQLKSDDATTRRVIVKPISMGAERDLRYSHWELSRRRKVEKDSESKIGYLHLRAMSGKNYTEFVRNFYPVFHRQGLIIDVRHNRGGNIDSWILEKLIRKAWFFWQPRVGQPYWNMQYAFRGHMVVLCDEYTASDGEAFTEGFRRLELGKVIGKRTWGGEIWLTSSNRLVDKGIASAAEFGVYGPEREWLIEGHGVEPDIVIENMPHATFQGQDAQLDRAIEFLLQKIKSEPVTVPQHPDYPRKR